MLNHGSINLHQTFKSPKCMVFDYNMMANDKKPIIVLMVFFVFILLSYLMIFNFHLSPPLKNVSYTLSDLEIAEANSDKTARYIIQDGRITIDTVGELAAGNPVTFTVKDFAVVFYSMKEGYSITNISSIQDVSLRIRFMKNISEPRYKFDGPKIEIPLDKNAAGSFKQNSQVSKEFTFMALLQI